MTKEKDKNIIQTIIKGPSLGYTDNFPKREMWEEIAKELNGEFKIKYNSGYQIEIHNISIPYKIWNIKISVSDSSPLKFQISFATSQNFELSLSWEDFIEKVLKKLGKTEIELGCIEFDKHYLVKTNRSDLVKEIITPEIQKTLLKYNVYSISYQTDTTANTAELISVIQRRAGDKEMIFELIDMYKLLIDNLEKLRII
jgi:methyltransferase-like protein